MAGIREFLEAVRDNDLVAGHFRGVLHVAIGRRMTAPDGSTVSAGVTWRELAGWLKLLRFDTDLVQEFGADPDALAPRDRTRFWYGAIAMAKVDSAEAFAQAERLVERLKGLGFIVGPPPAGSVPPPPKPRATAPPKEKDKPAAKEKDKPAKSPKPKKKR